MKTLEDSLILKITVNYKTQNRIVLIIDQIGWSVDPNIENSKVSPTYLWTADAYGRCKVLWEKEI